MWTLILTIVIGRERIGCEREEGQEGNKRSHGDGNLLAGAACGFAGRPRSRKRPKNYNRLSTILPPLTSGTGRPSGVR